MNALSIRPAPSRFKMRADQCEALARHCADRLEQAREPRIRARLMRELGDWLELAEQRSVENGARLMERLSALR